MSCGCNLRKRITKERINLSKRDVYLDYNGTTKPSVDVLAAVEKVNRIYWGNPSAQNSRGVTLYNYIESHIFNVLKLFRKENYEVFFDTSSSSIIKKINNLQQFNIITTNIEHDSLLKNSNFQMEVNSLGIIDITKLQKTLETTKDMNNIIIYSPVNHETGNLQPIKEIFNLATNFNVPVILDAVQTIHRLELKSWLQYCNGFYYSGHKINGLQGSAALITEPNLLNFNTKESTLPFSLYEGTFNTSGTIALLEATHLLLKNLDNNLIILKTLHNDGLNILSKLKDSIILESDINGAPGIINLSFPDITIIEELLMFLSRDGVQIGRLSACSGDINAVSHVLKAMGRDINRSKTSVRLSFGADSKRDDFFRFTSGAKEFLTSNNIYRGL